MTLTQMRRSTIKVNLQWPPSTATSTVNTYLCLPLGASLLDLERIVILPPTFRVNQFPIAEWRGAFRAPSPAGSFLGGFRTPATAHLARSFTAVIRNPAHKQPSRARACDKHRLPLRATCWEFRASSARGQELLLCAALCAKQLRVQARSGQASGCSPLSPDSHHRLDSRGRRQNETINSVRR
jgi:hypothetical protein